MKKLLPGVTSFFTTGLIVSLVLVLTALASAARAQAQQVDFAKVSNAVITQGDAAIGSYVPKDGLATADKISSLYFDVFEGSGMEAAIGLQDMDLKGDIEAGFSGVIGLTTKGAPRKKVAAAWRSLRQEMAKAAQFQATVENGFLSTLLQSFLILVREGFEAILIITALATYLRRAGESDKVRVIYFGAGWGIAASLLTAYILTSVIALAGASRGGLEGVTLLLASAVLFYVSYWFISKREADRWQQYVHGRIERALSGGRLLTLGFAAFLAVYREGAETVLFYQALAAGAQGQTVAVVSGFVGAVAALGVLFWVMRSASFRLPMGAFFSLTAVFLYFLSVTFAGTAIVELQEVRWVSITPLDWVPRVSWLGLFPTVEGVAVQAALIVPLLGGGIYLWLRKRRNHMAVEAKGARPQ